MIPQIIPKMMLFPLVFQILALALTLTHPSHVGLDEGEERKGMSNCHSTSRPSIPMVSAWDYGKQLKHRYDCSALAGEKAETESLNSFKFKENSFLNPTDSSSTKKEVILVPSTLSSTRGKQWRHRFIHNFKETALVTFT